MRSAGEWAFTIAGLRPQGGARAYASEDETLNASRARFVEAAAGVEPLRLPDDTYDLGQRFDQGEQVGDVLSVPAAQVTCSRVGTSSSITTHSPSTITA
jgi:hypothetical protein